MAAAQHRKHSAATSSSKCDILNSGLCMYHLFTVFCAKDFKKNSRNQANIRHLVPWHYPSHFHLLWSEANHSQMTFVELF